MTKPETVGCLGYIFRSHPDNPNRGIPGNLIEDELPPGALVGTNFLF